MREKLYKIESLLGELSRLVGSIADNLVPGLPTPDPVPPPEEAPKILSDDLQEIIFRVYSTPQKVGIQISKVNPQKYGGKIGIEFKDNDPSNGYGNTLEKAFSNYSGPINSVPDSKVYMSEAEQIEWKTFLEKTKFPVAVRRDRDFNLYVDFFKNNKVQKRDGFISTYEAVKTANEIMS